MIPKASTERINQLLEYALHCGATNSACIAPKIVQVENRLAAYCRDPKCPNFAQSLSCPPHVQGPAWMRSQLSRADHAIALRLEIDAESLHGPDRPEVMRILHTITASVELKAKELGFRDAMGFAGGSCKMSFCSDYATCQALLPGGTCRNPESARPSMSGYGINVGKLMSAAGWSTNLFSSEEPHSRSQAAWVAALILVTES